jgi:hypothetical protein
VQPAWLHRSPAETIFQAPLVLVNQGFTHFAFSRFDVLFQHSLQSISGPREDESLLIFLTAVLNSPLAKYYLFHTSANWGVERGKVHFEELLQIPFPLPEQTKNPARSWEIVKKIEAIMCGFSEELSTSEAVFKEPDDLRKTAVKEMTKLVYRYFDLSRWEQMLVEDTDKIFEPSSTPTKLVGVIPTLDDSTPEGRQAYADILCQTLNRWAKRSGHSVVGETRIAKREGLALLTLTKHSHLIEWPTCHEEEMSLRFRRILERVAKASLSEGMAGLVYLRGFALFEETQVHILKPLAVRHWTRTAALNDADELACFMAEQGEGEE